MKSYDTPFEGADLEKLVQLAEAGKYALASYMRLGGALYKQTVDKYFDFDEHEEMRCCAIGAASQVATSGAWGVADSNNDDVWHELALNSCGLNPYIRVYDKEDQDFSLLWDYIARLNDWEGQPIGWIADEIESLEAAVFPEPDCFGRAAVVFLPKGETLESLELSIVELNNCLR